MISNHSMQQHQGCWGGATSSLLQFSLKQNSSGASSGSGISGKLKAAQRAEEIETFAAPGRGQECSGKIANCQAGGPCGKEILPNRRPEDLISIGTINRLMKAVEPDTTRRRDLATCASRCIRNELGCISQERK